MGYLVIILFSPSQKLEDAEFLGFLKYRIPPSSLLATKGMTIVF